MPGQRPMPRKMVRIHLKWFLLILDSGNSVMSAVVHTTIVNAHHVTTAYSMLGKEPIHVDKFPRCIFHSVSNLSQR